VDIIMMSHAMIENFNRELMLKFKFPGGLDIMIVGRAGCRCQCHHRDRDS
jgi:hypothetical protein